MADRGLPESFPNGWFQVAWAGELEPGAIKPVRFFDRDLIVWRSAAGECSVWDAHCPHRGAHLGFGGQVIDDAVLCPMHGRSWGPDGNQIGPSDPSCRQQVKVWPTREINGLILVWHDATGGPPSWEAPALREHGDPGFYPMYPHAASTLTVRWPPQLPLENNADLAHVKYVHRWDEIPEIDFWNVDSEKFSNSYHGDLKSSRGTSTVTIKNEAWGIGLLYSWFSGIAHSTQVVATTPIDLEKSQMWHSIYIERQPGDEGDRPSGVAKAIVDAQFAEGQSDTQGDKRIWENMHYVSRPPFVPEEARMFTALQRWSRKFYPAS